MQQANIVSEESKIIKQSMSSLMQDEVHFHRIAGFASAELLAHTVPYTLAKAYDSTLSISIFDADGEIRNYTVTEIETKNPAIVGYILAGTGDNPRVHVVFRGTADGASTVRDLEYGGAGQESFNAEKDLILSQVDSVIRKRANEWNQPNELKIKLSISGHSLGGADAQNCFVAITDVLSKLHGHKRVMDRLRDGTEGIKKTLISRANGKLATASHSPLTVIDSIELNHVNSAGVTHDAAKRCNKAAVYLVKSGVKIHLRALRVGGDGCQQTGQTNVLADIADEKIATIDLLKVASNKEGLVTSRKSLTVAAGVAAFLNAPILVGGLLAGVGVYGTFASHTSTHFNKPIVDEASFSFCDNCTDEGVKDIKETLSYAGKSTIDNNILSHTAKKLVHSVTNVFVHNRKVSPQILNQFVAFKEHVEEHELNYELYDVVFNDKDLTEHHLEIITKKLSL